MAYGQTVFTGKVLHLQEIEWIYLLMHVNRTSECKPVPA